MQAEMGGKGFTQEASALLALHIRPAQQFRQAADAAVAQVVKLALDGQVGLLGGVQPAVDPGQRAVARPRQLLRRRQRPARAGAR